MRVVTGTDIKKIDAWAENEAGLPSLLLMENAGSAAALKIRELLGDIAGCQLVFLVGKGNNGGDALVAARRMHNLGAEVKLFLLFPPENFRGAVGKNWSIIEKTGIKWHHLEDDNSFYLLKLSLNNCKMVIDGLFGTGFKGNPEDKCARAIDIVNESGRPILAIDIPSGLDADRGRSGQPCVRADYTVTFAWPKLGLLMYPGRRLTGELTVADISLPVEAIKQCERDITYVDKEYAHSLLPSRDWEGHKNTFGHLLILAGSAGMTGAAMLAAKAALRTGTGLVTAGLPCSVSDYFDACLPEVLTRGLAETRCRTLAREAWPEIEAVLPDKKALVFGPGLSGEPEIQELLVELLDTVQVPLVIDADGLNALASDITVLQGTTAPIILTPHPGEMARLLGCPVREVQENRMEVAAEAADRLGVIVVLKGAGTVIAAPDGRTFLNSTGNPALATAGTGDVLAGAIGGLLAQGLEPLHAAVLGVYIHGLAGDLVACVKGLRGVIAGDVLETLPDALKHLSGETWNTEASIKLSRGIS